MFFNIYNVSLPCVTCMVTLKTKIKCSFSDDCIVTIEPCRMIQSMRKTCNPRSLKVCYLKGEYLKHQNSYSVLFISFHFPLLLTVIFGCYCGVGVCSVYNPLLRVLLPFTQNNLLK